MKVQSLQVGAIETNCYILCDEETNVCAVIDPGDEGRRIASAVRGTGCRLAAILLTHGHYDHTEGIAELRTVYPGTPVYLNHADTPEGGAPEMLFPRVPGTIDYGDGDKVQIGSLTVEVIATPGHTRGSVSLRCGTALFSGDTLFAGDCGRTDLWGGDMNQMERSLGKLGCLDGNLTVYPGHMEASTLEQERKWNPWLRHGMQVTGKA